METVISYGSNLTTQIITEIEPIIKENREELMVIILTVRVMFSRFGSSFNLEPTRHQQQSRAKQDQPCLSQNLES